MSRSRKRNKNNENRNVINRKALEKMKKKKEKEEKQKKKRIQKLKKKNSPREIRKRKIRARLLKIFSVVVIFIIAIVLFLLSPIFYIKNINVSGNNIIKSEEVLNKLAIDDKTNIFKINEGEINKKFKDNHYVENVKVNKKLPDTIDIIINERKICYYIENEGTYTYIDNNGNILEISTDTKQDKLIKLIGTTTSPESIIVGKQLCDIDRDKLNDIESILNISEKYELKNLIDSIDISSNENYILFLNSENKSIYIGNAENLNLKMNYAKKIIEMEKGKTGKVFVNINLNEKNAFFREDV